MAGDPSKNVEAEAKDPLKRGDLGVQGGKAESHLTLVQQEIGDKVKNQIHSILETVNALQSNEKDRLDTLITELPLQLSRSLAEQYFDSGRENQRLSDELVRVKRERDEKSDRLAELSITKRLKEQQKEVELKREKYQKQKLDLEELRKLRNDSILQNNETKVLVQASHDKEIKELMKYSDILRRDDKINEAEIALLTKQVKDLTADLERMARQDAGIRPPPLTVEQVAERRTLENSWKDAQNALKLFTEIKLSRENTVNELKDDELCAYAKKLLDESEKRGEGRELLAKVKNNYLALQSFDAEHKTGPARSDSVISRTLSFSTGSSELTCVECDGRFTDFFKCTDCLKCNKPLLFKLPSFSSEESVPPDYPRAADATDYNAVAPIC